MLQQCHVIDPGRLTRLPHTTGKTYAQRTPEFPRASFKLLRVDRVAIPEICAPEDIIVLEDGPNCACIPVKVLSNGTKRQPAVRAREPPRQGRYGHVHHVRWERLREQRASDHGDGRE